MTNDELIQLAEEAAQMRAEGNLAVKDCLEKDFERGVSPVPDPVPEAMQTTEQTEEKVPESGVKAAPVPPAYIGRVSTKKLPHHQLILEGVASKCVHCKLTLTDADSVQAGMGPICRKRGGYNLEPDQPDEFAAMAVLSIYPELVEFLVQNHKSSGIRGLMNGLVKIAALNRRTEVHDVITDAVELLGYRQLASVLREALMVLEIRDSEANPSFHVVWVKRSEWTPRWSYDIRSTFNYPTFSKQEKGYLIPKTDKGTLWGLIKKHYSGLCMKCPDGKIARIPKS